MDYQELNRDSRLGVLNKIAVLSRKAQAAYDAADFDYWQRLDNAVFMLQMYASRI